MWSDHRWPWTQRITGLPHALILIAYPGDAAATFSVEVAVVSVPAMSPWVGGAASRWNRAHPAGAPAALSP